MSGFVMTIDASEVHDLADAIGRHVEEFPAQASTIIGVGGHRLVARSQVLAPVDTGNLRSSIGLDMEPGTLGFEAGPTAAYGAAVEFGVPHPYVIRARDGGMLRFVVDGRVVFARQVTHPPSPPRPYMGPAYDEVEPGIVRDLADLATFRVLGGLGRAA